MKRPSGFTIIEFLFVMTIAGILTAIAIPSFKYVTASNRVAQEINGLLGDLQYARAEAIKEGFWVTACASTDGASCSGSNSWRAGWIIFSDVNNNQSVNAGDLILRVNGAFSGTDTLTADNSMTSVTFNREGFASMYPGTTTAITLPVTLQLNTVPTNLQWERCLAITAVGGTTSTEKSGTGNCP
jgi:type IV fimbrial biogenesis protein FimT